VDKVEEERIEKKTVWYRPKGRRYFGSMQKAEFVETGRDDRHNF
jgi:hypothetical protein